ncbi:MAG: NAD(P)-dependent oxidoreductase [Bacteroidetes bacterium]|nr:NAD(P)-dependent oxidoreductase [Bacteroidota bacterium]
MKKVVLIGASGFVGTALLKEILNRGITVTAIVRNPEKITIKSDLLSVVKADVSSAETVTLLCKGFDEVISAYNPGWTNPKIYEDTLNVYSAILEGVKKAGVKRLLCVGGAGSLFCAPNLRVMDSGVIPEAYLPAVKGLAEFYLKILMNEKNLDWIFFSPAGTITPGQRTGKFRLGKDDLIVDKDGNSNISVEDYAMAMIDELENPKHHHERFTIGY